MKRVLLLLLIFSFAQAGFSQTINWRASYNSTNELGIAAFTSSKFYPEIRLKYEDEYYGSSEYSLFIRNDVSFREDLNMNISWGIGASLCEQEFGYLRLPVYLCKNNIIKENITLMLGVEFKSNLSNHSKLLPLIGVSINF